MPINMSEYKFYNEGDVQDYLALLGQLSDYYGKEREPSNEVDR
jgi:hypothetical protein